GGLGSPPRLPRMTVASAPAIRVRRPDRGPRAWSAPPADRATSGFRTPPSSPQALARPGHSSCSLLPGMWPGRPRDPRTGDLARRGSAEAGREAIRRRLAGVLVALLALSGHTRSAAESSEFEAAVAEVVLERNGTLVARGSGVVIAARAEDGAPACYLLTAGHVVKAADAATAIVVALPGEGGRRSVPGELVRRVDHDDRDLALLRAVAPDCRPVPVA